MGEPALSFMVCVDESIDDELLSVVEELGAGLELQSYGLKGVASPESWDAKLARHRQIAARFAGPRAVHGPFLGLIYFYRDHLLRDAVQQRLDRTFEVVRELGPQTLVVHTNWRLDHAALGLDDLWLDECARFWSREIGRYEQLGVTVAMENLLEPDPGLMIALCDRVASDRFKLCLDVGQAHVHLHDNGGERDEHLPPGQGTIDFDALFDALGEHPGPLNISLELEAPADVKLRTLKQVLSRFG
jgi:sugar phosphate isomerase/epimerase